VTRFLLLLAAAITATVLAPHATSSPPNVMPCCWAPQNQWDVRCVGTRFFYPPGYSTSDPGTWGQYSPWQGQCNSVGDSSKP
jgi:hypothetical protein